MRCRRGWHGHGQTPTTPSCHAAHTSSKPGCCLLCCRWHGRHRWHAHRPAVGLIDGAACAHAAHAHAYTCHAATHLAASQGSHAEARWMWTRHSLLLRLVGSTPWVSMGIHGFLHVPCRQALSSCLGVHPLLAQHDAPLSACSVGALMSCALTR